MVYKVPNEVVFKVELTVKLRNVSEEEIENSEVLHPDVISAVADLALNDAGQLIITLEEVFYEEPTEEVPQDLSDMGYDQATDDTLIAAAATAIAARRLQNLPDNLQEVAFEIANAWGNDDLQVEHTLNLAEQIFRRADQITFWALKIES
jgi:hypothetical protein